MINLNLRIDVWTPIQLLAVDKCANENWCYTLSTPPHIKITIIIYPWKFLILKKKYLQYKKYTFIAM